MPLMCRSDVVDQYCMAIWALLVGGSFLTGRFGPTWAMLSGPASSLALGAWAVNAEPLGYDMHGFGYFVGACWAVVCVIAAVLGRGLRVIHQRRTPPSAS